MKQFAHAVRIRVLRWLFAMKTTAETDLGLRPSMDVLLIRSAHLLCKY